MNIYDINNNNLSQQHFCVCVPKAVYLPKIGVNVFIQMKKCQNAQIIVSSKRIFLTEVRNMFVCLCLGSI